MQGIISADKKSSTPPIMSSMLSPNRGSGSSVGFDASSPRDGDAVEELDSLAHAADGLIRLREHSEDEVGHLQRSPEIVRFPQESLHNFRFSSTSTNLTDLVELRKSLMNRSLNFLKNDDIRPGRSPDTLPAHCTPFSLMVGDDLGRTKTKSVGHSPVAYFSVENYRASRRRQQSHPMPDIQETRHSPETNKTSRPATPLTPDDSEVLATIPERRTPSRTSTTSSSSCTTSYSNVATSSDDDKSNKLDVPTCKGRRRLSSNMIFPHPALHNPSRFLPQNQAILTTYNDWRIILSNDVAALVLAGSGGSCRGLVGKSVVDFIDPTYRSRFLDMVMKRKEELNHLEDSTGGMVLICGNVLPIVKQDGTRSAASLWLKEKRNDAGSAVYIWIFEEVFETVIHVSVDMEGIIHYVDDSVHDLYGYDVDELIHKPVDILIPSLSRNNSTSNKQNMWTEINKLRSFGSKTKLGAYFPIVAKVHTVSNSSETTEPAPHLTLRITSIPMIAGLVTIRRDGSIEGCNAVFARYMFGFSQEELVQQHKNIADLMPQFPTLLRCLQRDDLLQHGIIINNHICRKLIADMDDTENKIPSVKNPQRRRLTQAPNGQTLPVLIAIHRDGTPFEVQLQLKLVEGSDDVCALWITFDRDATFSRVGHVPAASPPIEIKQHDGLGLPTAKKPLAPSENKKADPAPAAAKQLIQKQQNPDETENKPMRIITSFSRPNVVSHNPQSPVAPPTPTARENSSSSSKESSSQSFPEYSAQTNATTIDDYEILDNLGQGAYGLVKLAVRKDDPERKKVVIKYVIKSKILVDCWTKDRKLGVIPVEIHILHTLRRLPHENCSDMLDYFEDDDYYYIVMGLHGVGMDLFDYIELKNGMMDDEIRHIFKQIALAVRHLHDNKIVHRDIKDENVVLDENGGVRLIDFGSAAYLKGRRYDTFVGTLDYAAPEILAGQTYEGPPQDIWALGILLYTLVYRENPFYDIDEILGHELRVPFVLSEGSLDLIRKMLDRNVESRPNIHEVLAHPWLN